jgi:putative tryptophan/tyrosine transport system substrate-binding protein
MRRREFIAGFGSAAVWSVTARAQQFAIPVVGYLNPESLHPLRTFVTAFENGLAERGHIVGQNVAIECRWGDGSIERLPSLAAELV